MELVRPSSKYKDSFIAAVEEFRAEEQTNSRIARYSRYDLSELRADFDAFVARQLSKSEGHNLPPGHVPMTEYWLVDGDQYIGGVNIRHRLTPHLTQIGGHIGYDIRPSMRGRGYGNAILQLSIPKARELGIDRILLTCDESNTASRKVIEKNGGVLENKAQDPETGIDKLRFWIN